MKFWRQKSKYYLSLTTQTITPKNVCDGIFMGDIYRGRVH
ncbi:hypothetical protein DSBG_4379 [Desulfosporosinus sp. BG]|nr:hypothetical protein DSBG_4379 [Desulfosporosinus sp. BG]